MFLKKIKKFFRSPRQFFLGSLWFKTPFFDNKHQNGNVIIVTTLGQLNQAESIIKFNGIEQPTLVIMYTIQNMRMPRLMYNTASKKLFRSIYMYELPLKPGNVDLKKYNYMRRGYKKLLKELKPVNLYVMSFFGHYSMLLNYAKKRGVNLHLVEEGTATYAPLIDGFNAPLSKLERFLQRKFISKKGYYDNFNELHISFPDYGKKAFKADKYNYFLAHMSGVNVTSHHLRLLNKYRVSQQDYIYVSQIFPVDDEVYYSSIIYYLENILKEIDGKIFIKLHPKEMEKRRIMQMFLNKSKDNPRLVVFNEPPFLIDPFIYVAEPKGVIGVTSTALAYAPLLAPNIETISIARLLIDRLKSFNQKVDLIESHLEILNIYDFVDVINKIPFSKTQKFIPNLNSEDLILLAEKSYKERKYYHAIFYWRLAFGDDMTMLGIKTLWYYNALNKTRQYYKMKEKEMSYIDGISVFNNKDVSIWNNIKKDYINNKVR